jgi:DNA-binding transcriptional LysR family regulator
MISIELISNRNRRAVRSNSLEALEAVVKYGDFSRAAEHLHKVQSALSHQVRKIEQQLGLTVFNRDGYRVYLTPAGEAILAEGRRLLAQASTSVRLRGSSPRNGYRHWQSSSTASCRSTRHSRR